MRKIKGFFAARLSLFTIVSALVIFSILFSVFYNITKKQNIETTISATLSLLDNMQLQIDGRLSSVQVSVNNVSWMFDETVTDSQKINRILRQRLVNNTFLESSFIAFAPHYVSSQGKYFMLTAIRDKGLIKFVTRGDELDDYFTRDWYLIPFLLKKDYWSEPYFEGNERMCTYSHPLVDKKGRVYAIFGASISLEKFASIVEKLQPIKDSYSFMISRNGYYMTHRRRDRILNETVFSLGYEAKDTAMISIGKAMIAGHRGYVKFNNEVDGVNVESYAFYSPIPSTGWSLCTVCPEKVILSSLNRTLQYIMMLFALCIIIFFIAMVFVSRKLLNELKVSTSANERINSELHIAQSIQMGMIPKIFPPFPDRSDVDLYAFLRPAKEVGGDLYDFFISEGKLYFAIGDVSGKGVPASLFMAVTRSLFRNIASQGFSPSKVMQMMNSSISENNESNMFVTMFISQLDLDTGRLVVCNAGHNPPIIVHKGSQQAGYMKIKKNLPVGLMPDFLYHEEEHCLIPGDGLLLYTDGVTEAENEKKELFGEKVLLEVVRRSSSCDAFHIIEAILNEIERHVGQARQSDDITIFSFCYVPGFDSYKKQLLIENRCEDIEKLTTFVDELAEDCCIDMKMQSQLNLALEEAVVNVVNYAYPKGTIGEIDLLVTSPDKESLTFVLSDSGVPFDPTKVPEADVTKSAEDRPIGGLGIFLVRKIMDSVIYRYSNGKNELIMKKRINK